VTVEQTSADVAMWNQVLLLHTRIEQELTKAHRLHGLGLSEYRALSRLAVAEDGELRIQELAGAIGLNQSSVSRLVVRLEEAGLTRRATCDKDRRGVYSVITEPGRARLAVIESLHNEILSRALNLAATDPALRDTVTALRDTRLGAPRDLVTDAADN